MTYGLEPQHLNPTDFNYAEEKHRMDSEMPT